LINRTRGAIERQRFHKGQRFVISLFQNDQHIALQAAVPLLPRKVLGKQLRVLFLQHRLSFGDIAAQLSDAVGVGHHLCP